ncbi:Na+/H+ antiporter [Spirosoma endophyticum]|uniref:Sodium/proton antiporter, CPA1 family n=1 Tax=Spirosoma endophyticum TaxID=662367 RepID=A0A1I1FS09_9BACT|nr:Na+/H+ antiporter [Spirosoma endophyticum]SFC02207.1 sodium/proton antiporter, CPA1 family [Spirosoma endophyticum]
MHPLETVLLLLIFVIGLALIARRLNLVFPIVLTVGGLVIGFIPGLPNVGLDSSVVLLVFLPPILYSAAWYTNWSDFRRNLEPIVVLALGLVLATSICIAYVAQSFIPGFTLATGLLLGAIVSPSDAVAATAIMKTLAVPRKIVAILEGESLVNDATALVIFQLALATMSTGNFSLTESLLDFIRLAGGGIGVGLVIGYLSFLLHKHGNLEPALETVLTFVTAYSAYIAAEHLHLSGVLSVVTAGLLLGRKQSSVHSPITRMQAVAVWDFVVVLLNGLIFILIGLQLPHVVDAIKGQSLGQLVWFGLLISLTTVVIRFLGIFLADTVSTQARKALHLLPVFPSYKHTTLLAYISMRGIVSLAAALSIPERLPNGLPCPGRNLILFITFCVILFTLVGQGSILPIVIRALQFGQQSTDYLSRQEIRRRLSRKALAVIHQVVDQEGLTGDTVKEIIDRHQQRVNELERKDPEKAECQHQLSRKLTLSSIQVQRAELLNLRDAQLIDVDLFHELENELDREEIQAKTSDV